MKEILGQHLHVFFDGSTIPAKCTYQGDDYEVWEVSDSDFEVMRDIDEGHWEDIYPECWWRYCTGCNIDSIPTHKLMVNGEEITGWKNMKGKTKYSSLSEYLLKEFWASSEKNVCALAVDLAKHNNMTLGELFTKYEG